MTNCRVGIRSSNQLKGVHHVLHLVCKIEKDVGVNGDEHPLSGRWRHKKVAWLGPSKRDVRYLKACCSAPGVFDFSSISLSAFDGGEREISYIRCLSADLPLRHTFAMTWFPPSLPALSVCLQSAFVLASPSTLFAESKENVLNPEAVAEVLAGRRTDANAAWWGFNEEDATEPLQAAIRSGAKRVIVPNVGKDWIVRPLQLASDQELVLESGVVITARRG